MGFSSTYDIATPTGADDPVEGDDRIREIKAALQERLNVEHVFDLTGTEVSAPNSGKHKNITTDTIVTTGDATINGNGAVGGSFDVFGNLDPAKYITTNGGFLDEDDMSSNAANKIASQQSIKAYVDNQIDAISDDDVYGAGVSKSASTNYTATTSGILVVRVTVNAGIASEYGFGVVKSDAAATPTTVVGKAGFTPGSLGFDNSLESVYTITVPIIKGKKYRVEPLKTGSTTVTFNEITFYPNQ